MADTAGSSSSKGSARSKFSNRAHWNPEGHRRRARSGSDHHGSQARPRPQPDMAGLKDEINRGKASYDTKSPHSEQPETEPSKTNKPEPWEPILSLAQLTDLGMALLGPPRLVFKILGGAVGNILRFLWNILCCFGWINASPVSIILLTSLTTVLAILGIISWGLHAVTGFSVVSNYWFSGISVDPYQWFSGSHSGPQSQDFHVRPNKRPLIFDPPRHGGVLDSLSSQSYILRQAYASTLTLPANLSADLDQIAAEIHLSQSRFTKMMKGYEQCDRNFRNDDLQFTYQVFDHNETLADYEDRRDTGSEVTRSWVGWFSSAKAGAKRWHPREILDIASSLTESIPSQQQKLNATITCLRSALEDMEATSMLLGDPVHDLDAIKNIAPRGIASRVSGIRSNLVMTIRIIGEARKGLQAASEMVKDTIHELERQFTSIKNKSADLERVMKAGEVDDSSRRELKNEMERMCQHVLEKRKKD